MTAPLIIPKTGDWRHQFNFYQPDGATPEDVSTTTASLVMRHQASGAQVTLALTAAAATNGKTVDVDKAITGAWASGLWAVELRLAWPDGYDQIAVGFVVQVVDFGLPADSGVSNIYQAPDSTRIIRVASGPPGAAGTGGGGGAVTSVAGRTGAVTLASADLADFTEASQDVVSGLLAAGGNITLTYNDPAGTLTIAAASAPVASVAGRTGAVVVTSADLADFTEASQDVVGGLLAAGTNITLTYNDPANTLTIAAASAPVSSVAGRTGAVVVTSADLADFTEAAQDAAAAALVAGSNITVTYNDAANTITIASTAGSGLPTVAKAADYSILAADAGKLITVDASAGGVVLTLPASAPDGSTLNILKTDTTVGARLTGAQTSTAGNVTLRTSGAAEVGWLQTKGDSAYLVCNSNIWTVLRWNIAPLKYNFTASGTFTKPPLLVAVDVMAFGAGGGGGSGRRGALTTLLRGGGGGGGAGAVFTNWLTASAIGATETVTVGAGGGGAAGITTDTNNGSIGTAGGATTFGALVRAAGGNPGQGGLSTTGGSGGAALTAQNNYGVAGAGLNGSNGTGAGNPGTASHVGSGSGGGGFSTADVATNGGSGGAGSSGSPTTCPSGSAGAGSSAGAGGNGGDGTAVSNTDTQIGGGGGGGGGAGNTVGGAGGAGGAPGAGGGGGGASNNGATSGAGGVGGRGEVRLTAYFD